MRAVLFAVQVMACADSSPSNSTPESGYARVIDGAIRAGVPGLQAYVRRGAVEWRCAAGLASIERGRPMTPSDRIRVASITKMLTYATVMELNRAGQLQLSDRAVDLLPAGTLDGIAFAHDITVAQLLDHTSGLHNYNGANRADFFAALCAEPGRASRRWTPEELIAFARLHPPTGRPGERRGYSSTGYMVLELILERVGKSSLPELYERHLFGPLGMKRSAVEGSEGDGDSITPSYAIPSQSDRDSPSPFGDRKPVRHAGLVNLSEGLKGYNAWAGAAGAVATTVDDMARFMDAVRANGRLVLHDQAAELARLAARPDGFLAWNGGSWGIQGTILYEPGRDITVIVLSNASNTGTDTPAIARKLLAVARATR